MFEILKPFLSSRNKALGVNLPYDELHAMFDLLDFKFHLGKG